MRTLTRVSLIALLPAAAFCQPESTKPAFEIADVHASPRTDWVKNRAHAMQGGFLSADRYDLRRATMLDMIRLAYNVDADKVYGGPAWLDYDRFEVVGRTKRGTRPEVLRQMLQTLLEDRFHLVSKTDTRQMPGFVLSRGKGELKIKPATETSDGSGCRNMIPMTQDGVTYSILQCRNVTMEALAAALQRPISPSLAPIPVVDSTGLQGNWDFDLQYERQASGSADRASGMTDALDKLGLKLESTKVPQPVLVVESVNEQPSANQPDVAEILPPLPPPQFEVASVKLPCNGDRTESLRFEAGGRVTATCMPILGLIREAWNLEIFERPAAVPKWLEDGNTTTHNISIVAKAPAGIAPNPQDNAQAHDILNMMLRSLLMDRFRMKVHYEDRPMDSYSLVAVKPKLTKADPEGRTGCSRQGQQQQGRVLMVKLVCKNMTMTQFAEQIRGIDTDMFYPVQDATGISGSWDFTINYDAMANLYARFPAFERAAAAPDGEAPEPSGSVTFKAAVEKDLGLKLEMHKRPQPVLVIDHMEEKPIEN